MGNDQIEISGLKDKFYLFHASEDQPPALLECNSLEELREKAEQIRSSLMTPGVLLAFVGTVLTRDQYLPYKERIVHLTPPEESGEINESS